MTSVEEIERKTQAYRRVHDEALALKVVEHFSKPTHWFFHHYGVGDCEVSANFIAGQVKKHFPFRDVKVREAGVDTYESSVGISCVDTTYYVVMEKLEKGLSH